MPQQVGQVRNFTTKSLALLDWSARFLVSDRQDDNHIPWFQREELSPCRQHALNARDSHGAARNANPDWNGPRVHHEFWLGDARKKESPATRAGGAARERPGAM